MAEAGLKECSLETLVERLSVADIPPTRDIVETLLKCVARSNDDGDDKDKATARLVSSAFLEVCCDWSLRNTDIMNSGMNELFRLVFANASRSATNQALMERKNVIAEAASKLDEHYGYNKWPLATMVKGILARAEENAVPGWAAVMLTGGDL